MALSTEGPWKRPGLAKEKLFILCMLTVVLTEHLVNRLVKRCRCSGLHLIKIQARIWEMNSADCTDLLSFVGN